MQTALKKQEKLALLDMASFQEERSIRASDYLHSDIGAGDLFADTYRGRIRYLSDVKQWALDTGKKWKIGAEPEIQELAKELATKIMPGMASEIADDTRRMNWLKWCAKLQVNTTRDAMLQSARTKSEITATMDDFDSDARYFNVKNGVLDIQTMKFLPYDPKYMLSMIANVEYNPLAECPRFDRFIEEITCGDDGLALFVQKVKGYTLEGNPRDDCLFIEYGPSTRNGKTTLERTCLNLYGDYGGTSTPETLAVNRYKNGSTANPDLARLKGVRCVNMPEPGKGLELDGSLVKQLTGRDTILARNLYQGFFEFVPQFVVWMNANYLPIINDNTLFKSSRIFIIPFNAHFPADKQERDLLEQFSTPEAKSYILNWMLAGLALYRREGLRTNIPKAITDATNEYADDSDSFGAFLRECIKSCENDFTLTKTIYNTYGRWALENGYRPMSMKSMVGEMKRRGYRDKRKTEGSGFTDIILNGDLPTEWR